MNEPEHYTAEWLKSKGWMKEFLSNRWHFWDYACCTFHEAIRIEKQREETPCE